MNAIARTTSIAGLVTLDMANSALEAQDAGGGFFGRGGQPLPAHADGVAARLKAWGIETVKVRISKEE